MREFGSLTWLSTLLAAAASKAHGFFYQTSGGAEIDLLLAWPDDSMWAIEIKRSLAPKIERGFHVACADLMPTKKFAVYPGAERYRLASDIEVISLEGLATELSEAA